MKKLLTSSHKLVVPLLFGMWAGVHAQSLGTPSVTAWIGRPLEMTVPARFAGVGSGNECVQADVFFGDTRLPPGRVRATILGTDPQNKRVRIETDTLIDEPVVTVSVRAGCQGAITRSYTLLPELPSEQVIAGLVAQRPWAAPSATALSPAMAAATSMAPPPLAAGPGATASTSPRLRPARAAVAAARESTPVRARDATSARARDPAPARTRTALARAPRQVVAAAPSGPRLRLEPIETDSVTLLRASTRLADPAGDAARRATAALLWQAINADPQEVLRTTVMLQGLERDLSQLRQDAGQTRAEMAALRQRLDASQPWYGSGATVQVMGWLLLLAAAAAGLFWYRTRHSAVEHWHAHAPDLSVEPAVVDDSAAAPLTPVETAPATAQPSQPMSLTEAAIPAVPDLPAAYAAAAGRDRQSSASPVPHPAPRGPVHFDVPVLRAAAPAQRRSTDGVLRVETLAATFEEMEFLSSLGLTVDAAGVLKSYLQDSGSPAPIAFFELIRLCEHEEDSAAAGLVRRRYAQVFGVEAPSLQEVTAPVGLESLAGLSGSITSLWNTPRVLRVIEDALFAVPTAGRPLTLQAGRDLLCLHDVAMNLIAEASSAPDAGDGHALAPWAHADNAAGAQAAMQAATDTGDGSVLGVDIDLGATHVAGARRSVVSVPGLDPALAQAGSDVAPLVAEMRAAAREAEERAAIVRRQAEEEDAFSAVMASERIRTVRH